MVNKDIIKKISIFLLIALVVVIHFICIMSNWMTWSRLDITDAAQGGLLVCSLIALMGLFGLYNFYRTTEKFDKFGSPHSSNTYRRFETELPTGIDNEFPADDDNAYHTTKKPSFYN